MARYMFKAGRDGAYPLKDRHRAESVGICDESLPCHTKHLIRAGRDPRITLAELLPRQKVIHR